MEMTGDEWFPSIPYALDSTLHAVHTDKAVVTSGFKLQLSLW